MVGAHVIMLCNLALICFIDTILKACTGPSSEVHQREQPRHGDCTRCVFPQRRYLHIERLEAGRIFCGIVDAHAWWFCVPSVSAEPDRCASGPGKLVVRRCRKSSNVGRGVTGPERQIRVVELVAAVW